MAKLSWEDVVTVRSLVGRERSNVEIARLLGVTEGAVRYQRRRLAQNAVDGRSKQAFVAESFRPAIDHYLASVREQAPSNVTDLFDFLVAEHDYSGSLRNLQRYVRSVFPAPPVRARRRVKGHEDSRSWGTRTFPQVSSFIYWWPWLPSLVV